VENTNVSSKDESVEKTNGEAKTTESPNPKVQSVNIPDTSLDFVMEQTGCTRSEAAEAFSKMLNSLSNM